MGAGAGDFTVPEVEIVWALGQVVLLFWRLRLCGVGAVGFTVPEVEIVWRWGRGFYRAGGLVG